MTTKHTPNPIEEALEEFDEKCMTIWDIPTIEQVQIARFIEKTLTNALKQQSEEIVEMLKLKTKDVEKILFKDELKRSESSYYQDIGYNKGIEEAITTLNTK